MTDEISRLKRKPAKGPSPGDRERLAHFAAKHDLAIPNLLPLTPTGQLNAAEHAIRELSSAAHRHGQHTLVRLLVTYYFEEVSSMGTHLLWGEKWCRCGDCAHRRMLIRELSGLVAQVYES